MSSLLSTLGIQKFEVFLPATKIRVEYRAYLVKEEKILMLASESKSEEDMMQAIKLVVQACTFDKILIDELPLVDLEYLFLKIRSKSVGESATPSIICPKCKKSTEVKIDLNKIEPSHNENHTSKITIEDNLIVEMRYPKYNDAMYLSSVDGDMDKMIELIVSCVERVHTPSATINADDVERLDIKEFISHFTQVQFQKILQFVETMPKLTTIVDFTCSHCQYNEKMSIDGVRDFF